MANAQIPATARRTVVPSGTISFANTNREVPGFVVGNPFANRGVNRMADYYARVVERSQTNNTGSQVTDMRFRGNDREVPGLNLGSFTPNATPSRSTESLLSLSVGSILGVNLGSTQELTNHLYDFELYIVNSNGTLSISPVSIQNLTINDNLVEIGCDGSVILNFDNDRIEYFNEFKFRNDGEDFLRFRLIPKDITKSLPGNTSLKITKKLWELNFVFSISDIQDVTPKTKSNTDKAAYTKLKRLYFKDVRRHLLDVVNIEYSTAYSPYAGINSNPADLSDINRSIKTGLCIDETIKQSFNYDSVLAQTALDVNGSEWDLGSTNLFYTSPATESGYELLMGVYSRHVCEDPNDFSLLRIDRNDGGIGYFTLKPFSKIFDEAGKTADSPGKLQIEHFFLRSSLTENSSGRTFRAPVLQAGDGKLRNDMQKDIKINDYNTIDNYEFVDISPSINMGFYNSRGVYSFDFAQRQFNIEFQNHSIGSSENVINGKYISKLYKGRSGSSLLENTSPVKQTNKNIYPHYSPYGDALNPNIRLPDGFQKLIKNGLLQNTCINFSVPGLTIRQAGTFIGIDRLNGSKDNSLDNKLCGQWFVVDVKHIIAAGIYYNTITAVKIHSF
jgi:hypothetical protein